MPAPSVDVVIAVHSPERAIERAVASVIDAQSPTARALVVIHNTEPGPVLERLRPWSGHPRLAVHELHDGIPSPAGPFNHGIAASTADFFAVMGSDDELAPGAIDSWLALQSRTRADVVIARIRNDARPPVTVPSPPVRLGRRVGLEVVADRLAYRNAPLGLISRARFGELRFTTGLRSGEDIAFSTALWCSGAAVAYDASGPAYIVHDDAEVRVTSTARPVREDVAFLAPLVGGPVFRALPGRTRIAVACKLFRLHVIGLVLNRTSSSWTETDRRDLADAVAIVTAAAPRALQRLSRIDRRLVELAADPDSPVDSLLAAAAARGSQRSLGSLLPRNPLWALAREAPLRWGLASIAVSRRGSAADR
ncbi:glycosyltransferase [Agromyces sp. NPDC057679]|uniref:glycosyltransferase n=1 Tax=Agromyces sp. NPDC057679 TaxID=3346207 RepID=UPI00366C5D37